MTPFYRDYLDAQIERRGTHAIKWDGCEAEFGRADLLPMWVADMDFRTVPAVAEALMRRAQHGIYGYTENTAAEKQAEMGWLMRRYGLRVAPEWILYSPGVVDSMYFCVRCLTQPGDRILIQPPIYAPFEHAIRIHGRTPVFSPLLQRDGGWYMDFDAIRSAFAGGVRMMLLCSPHNPVGRVWKREELEQLVQLANEFGVILVSDEIHADFNFGDIPHTRILSLEDADNCVMLTSATKSFNLAGLRQSSILVRNAEIRRHIADELRRSHADSPNIFGALAQRVAYTEGDEWMDAVAEYLRENRDLVVFALRERIPQIKCTEQMGSYLMWLDCRNVGVPHEELRRRLIEEAGVGLSDGLGYGEEGRGFFRLNIATQHARVAQAMQNIEELVRSINQ